MGYANGRFTIEGGPDGATCTKARGRADVTLSASALGAVSLGGTSLSTLARAGQVDEHKAGAVTRCGRLVRLESGAVVQHVVLSARLRSLA